MLIYAGYFRIFRFGCTARQWSHRELPQSTNAGFGFYHTAIGAGEDSPSLPGRNFGPLPNALPPSIRDWKSPSSVFDLLPDRPDESCQFSTDRYRRDDALLVIAILQLGKFVMQPPIRLAGDGEQPFRLILPAFLDRGSPMGALLIGPCRLDQNPPQINIA